MFLFSLFSPIPSLLLSFFLFTYFLLSTDNTNEFLLLIRRTLQSTLRTGDHHGPLSVYSRLDPTILRRGFHKLSSDRRGKLVSIAASHSGRPRLESLTRDPLFSFISVVFLGFFRQVLEQHLKLTTISALLPIDVVKCVQ